MGDRDVRVIYKTRTLDRDEPRPRIPTALDPYDNPYAAESLARRKYSSRNSTSTLDDDGSTTEGARSTTRSAYPVRDNERPQPTSGYGKSSLRDEARTSADALTRRSVVVDQGRGDHSPVSRARSVVEPRTSRDRGYADVDYERPREQAQEYSRDSRLRQSGSPYVIETRGQIVDISVPGRDQRRIYDLGPNQYVYDDSRPPRRSGNNGNNDSEQYSRSIEDNRKSRTIIVGRDYTDPPSKSGYDEDRSKRGSVRGSEYDRDDDWRLVESMKDTRIGSTRERDAPTERKGRSRAPTQSSEDSYVVVSPTKPSKSSERSRARSAIRRDYPESEISRRRSRSISFRDTDVDLHDVTQRRHERPGAEAEICGAYLRRPVSVSDYDGRSDTHSRYTDRRSSAAETNRYASTYRERDEPYGPQIGYEPKKRERSRRRRRDNDTEDGSYYSEDIIRKTTETRYR